MGAGMRCGRQLPMAPHAERVRSASITCAEYTGRARVSVAACPRAMEQGCRRACSTTFASMGGLDSACSWRSTTGNAVLYLACFSFDRCCSVCSVASASCQDGRSRRVREEKCEQ